MTQPSGGTTGTSFDAPEVSTDPIDVGQRSVGDLIGEVTNSLSTLMRQEMALAKAEMKEEATKTGKAAGMLGGAGFAGYMVALFLSIMLWWAIGDGIGRAWAALIVAAIWGVVGAILFSMGLKKMREVHPKPERTMSTIKEVPDALKGRQEATR